MSILNLEKFFEPKSVAVVGASRKSGSVGGAVVGNLLEAGYQGRIIPVNPNPGHWEGLECRASLREVSGTLDLAVIATPMAAVPDIIRDCGSKGVGAAVIISAGGRETGTAGRKLEERIRGAGAEGGVRILGPSSLGILRAANKLNASYTNHMLLPGRLAFVSQSGAICTAILDWSRSENIGFSHFVSVGNMLDVDFGDIIDYLGNDPKVASILLYVESLTDIRKFMSAARAVSRVKPIVALKAGRSRAGARAASAHTGADTGEDAVYEEAFKRAGIVRVDTIEDLFDCAEMMAKQPRPRGPGLAIITNAGGPGVMAADELASFGLEPVDLSPETLDQLDQLLPPFWSRGNPIDLVGNGTAEVFAKTVRICLNAEEVDAVAVILAPQARLDPAAVAASLRETVKGRFFPVFTVWMGGNDMEAGRRILSEEGIPTYSSPERAVRAFWHMYLYDRNLKMLQQTPPKFTRHFDFSRERARDLLRQKTEQGNGWMSDSEARELLLAYGFPVGRKGHPEEQSGQSPSPASYLQLMMGSWTDEAFGPVIYFGLGGELREVFRDSALGLPPLNRLLAGRMMADTKIWPLLQGGKKGFPADQGALEELLVRLSQLVSDCPEIRELHIDPITLHGGRPAVEGVRALVGEPLALSPLHLVISPYPNDYEKDLTTRDGVALHIRPIMPEDAPLLLELFHNLSPRSVYLRFCHPLKTLSDDMLVKFTQIDYDRELALVALDAASGPEKILGVTRAINSLDGCTAEFAVVVADAWQGRGVGACLLQEIMDVSKKRGLERLCGFILPENRTMRDMLRKAGWKSTGMGDGLYYYEVDLRLWNGEFNEHGPE